MDAWRHQGVQLTGYAAPCMRLSTTAGQQRPLPHLGCPHHLKRKQLILGHTPQGLDDL